MRAIISTFDDFAQSFREAHTVNTYNPVKFGPAGEKSFDRLPRSRSGIIHTFLDDSSDISHLLFMHISSENAHFHEDFDVYLPGIDFGTNGKEKGQCCSVRPYHSSL